MVVVYETDKGILSSALVLKNTVFPAVFLKPELYLLLALQLSVFYARRSGWYYPADYSLHLAIGCTSVTGSLMTFFIVFYNGNIFSRYQELYQLTKDMCENCIYVASILHKDVPQQDVVRKLARWLNCSVFVFLFERSGTGVGKSEFQQLGNLGLLTPVEIKVLRRHCYGQKTWAMPSFILMQWSMKVYRSCNARVADLEKAYYAMRKDQEDICDILNLPMPFQYWHITNMMLMLNLCLWAYAFALMDTYFAVIIYFFVQLMFQGLRELCVALGDPYGKDDCDFPLSEWVSGLYMRIQAIIEDPFDLTKVSLENLPPMHALKYGEDIIDVLAKSGTKQFQEVLKKDLATWQQAENERLEREERERKRKERKSQRKSKKSQHMTDEERARMEDDEDSNGSEEEEEDDD